jgi:hypothetical protein
MSAYYTDPPPKIRFRSSTQEYMIRDVSHVVQKGRFAEFETLPHPIALEVGRWGVMFSRECGGRRRSTDLTEVPGKFLFPANVSVETDRVDWV